MLIGRPRGLSVLVTSSKTTMLGALKVAGLAFILLFLVESAFVVLVLFPEVVAVWAVARVALKAVAARTIKSFFIEVLRGRHLIAGTKVQSLGTQ